MQEKVEELHEQKNFSSSPIKPSKKPVLTPFYSINLPKHILSSLAKFGIKKGLELQREVLW